LPFTSKSFLCLTVEAFFIICGDMVDAFPDQWPDIRAKQVEDLLKVYSDLDKTIPLICVCGNCDVGKIWDLSRTFVANRSGYELIKL